jgi:hypothetical protein
VLYLWKCFLVFRIFLKEEIDLGTINSLQYIAACSGRARTRAIFSAITEHKYRVTGRFYQQCSELVHKKHQLARMGDECGNAAIIENLRKELKCLSKII